MRAPRTFGAFAGILILPFLTMPSCSDERYGLSTDSFGRVIRLDKRTGEVAVVTADGVVPLAQASPTRETEAEWIDSAITASYYGAVLESPHETVLVYYALHNNTKENWHFGSIDSSSILRARNTAGQLVDLEGAYEAKSC
jgi:hypothetical protein